MFIPRYWARAEKISHDYHLIRWGYSNTSEADALAVAEQRLARTIEGFAAKDNLSGEEYPYGVLPTREEIIEEFHDETGELHAVITRNRYGSLVLNTDRIMFIDVDLEHERFSSCTAAAAFFWRSWFTTAKKLAQERQERSLLLLHEWLLARPAWQVRVYRTKAGLRYLVSQPALSPGSVESEEAMRSLGCDPRYIQLCRVQRCYRARLTPKPWRCGLNRPQSIYPWHSVSAEQSMRQWETDYVVAIQEFATCEFITVLGPTEIPTSAAQFIQVHDRLTKADSSLPLA